MVSVLLFCLLCYGCNKEVVDEDESNVIITFSVLGDSISSMAGTSPEGYPVYYSESRPSFFATSPWWYQFSDMSGWSFLSNSSYAGSTISKYAKAEASSFFSTERLSLLSQKGAPDYVMILGGTNDWSRSVVFKSVDPCDSTTFVGAYRYLILKLRKMYPSTSIVCLSIIPRDSGIDKKNKESWSIRDANEEISSICYEMACTYIDVTDCGLSNDIDRYTYDGLHPNAQGMQLIAQSLASQLSFLQNE